MITTRGANYAFERVTADQVAAAQRLTESIPPGSRILTLAANSPLGASRITDVRVFSYASSACPAVQAPVACATAQDATYIFSSASIDHNGVLMYNRVPGWSRTVMTELVSTGRYRFLTDTNDVQILERTTEEG